MYRDPSWMLAAFLTGGKQVICVREIATNVGVVVGSSTARKSRRRQSITRAIHACCSGSRRSAYGDQLRLRSAIDTSAATALSGTVKPALRQAPLAITAALSFHPATGSICQKATA